MLNKRFKELAVLTCVVVQILFNFELRVGDTRAGILSVRYSAGLAAHQRLKKQGVLSSFVGLTFPAKHSLKCVVSLELVTVRRETLYIGFAYLCRNMSSNDNNIALRCHQMHQYFHNLFSLPEVACDRRVHSAFALDKDTSKRLKMMLEES